MADVIAGGGLTLKRLRAPWILFGLLIMTLPLADSSCELRRCWDLYLGSQKLLGITDDFFYPSEDLPPADQREDYCIVRRTFYWCLDNQQLACRSDLSFHSLHRGSEERLFRLHCSPQGETIDWSEIPKNTPDGTRDEPPCQFTARGGHALCALYGDPHLRTFEGTYETCRLEGAWPLLDNEYVVVQVSNRPVSTRLKASTAITEVTVVIKQFNNCASKDYIVYQAYSGLLPAVFTDGRNTVGNFDSVYIKDVMNGAHIQIFLEHVDIVISVRLIGQFYSVAIKVPRELLNSTETVPDVDNADWDTTPVQLCHTGCPSRERIDPPNIMWQHEQLSAILDRHTRGVHTTSNNGYARRPAVVSQQQALRQCLAAGLIDVYLDSCVFDLVITGDSNFTQQSQLAMLDMLNLVAETRHTMSNRTWLPASWGEQRPYPTKPVDISSCCCFLRTNPQLLLCVLTLMYLVLPRLFHLDYIHRTSFILLLSNS